MGSEIAAYLETTETWYSMAFSDKEAGQRWDVHGQVPVGRNVEAILRAGDESDLARTRSNDKGKFWFRDLGLETGSYTIEVSSKDTGFIRTLKTTSVGQPIAGAEAEPNDSWQLANRTDFDQPLTGRMGKANENDYFLFTLDEEMADRVLHLQLEANPEHRFDLCLRDSKGASVHCRQSKGGVELQDLVLSPGDWGLLVSRAPEGAEYKVTLSDGGPIQQGVEVEPNDKVELASAVPANNRIKGRFSGSDTDFYKILVTDEPQLWRFQVIGDEIHELAYYGAGGHQSQVFRVPAGQRRVRLDNVFLLPGTHRVRVSGRDGGTYTLLARPIGPPNPDGEFEPNDDTSRMQRLTMGQTRTGLLADKADTDFYRFFLANWDHIRLTVQPAADGVINPQLFWYGTSLAQGIPGGAGEPISITGVLPPGDYYVSLRTKQASDAEYKLSLERLPRFSCATDCEPNGTSNWYLAAPMPPDLVLEGRTGEWRDTDPYQLPELSEPSELIIRSEKPVRLSLGRHRYDHENLKYDAEAGTYQTTVPAGGPYRLIVGSNQQQYRLELEFSNGPKAVQIEPLPIELQLVLDTDQVSAYRTHGQLVTGRLELKSTYGEDQVVELEATTSDHRWRVSFARSRVKVAANAGTTVPVKIHVPADAWADWPVRISLRARNSAGSQAETWREIAVDRDLAPVTPTFGWLIPKELLGGFNVGWDALGSQWTADLPEGYRSDIVRDGLVFAGASFACCSVNPEWNESNLPRLTLDLPGDSSLPVAGIALNHFGSSGEYRDIRQATFLVSEDGENFREVMSFETLPVETEQYFPLPEPVTARFVRLRVDSTFNVQSGSGGITMGEWKVILEPGHDLSGGKGFNLADPALGGHVVWDWPPKPYSPTGILRENKESHSAHMPRSQNKEYVIGFHHNRAARIHRIEWVYADELAAEKKFGRVTVAVSADSSVGPWQQVGEMDLGRSGSTASLDLEAPVWGRFVRFNAIRNPDSGSPAAPVVLRIWEVPTNEEYRSVLTEWGYGSPRAFYELQAGLQPEPGLKAADNDSRPRAASLTPGQLAAGQVALGKHEHWYRLKVAQSENTLRVTLAGDPTVRTVIELEGASGTPIPLRRQSTDSDTARHVFEAVVEPGSEVFFHIQEPPRNVVFTWDTSASVNAYLPTIYNALAAFSSQVIPGREAINMIPFSSAPLMKDWYGEPYVLQTILNDYPRGPSSSSAERTLRDSGRALAPMAGTKAIVVITDGITVHDGSMWKEMQEIQPRIFGIGVGGDEGWNLDVFEDWSRVNGGHYTHLYYQGEMEVAFDRAATLMRRPAGYTLEVQSEFREAPGPGTLKVTSAEGGGVTGGAAIELILDASGSMLKRLDGKRRIVIAKEVLSETVNEHIPAGTPVALRVFGHKEPNSCRTDLEIPMKPLDPAAATKTIQSVNAMNLAKTPIADSLAKVESDLKNAKGRRFVVLVTDGEETCEGDPEKVIQGLQDRGIEISLNIVGFAIDDNALEAQFESWAELGGGRYFSADSQEGLSDSLEKALQIPFTVYDTSGSVVGQGVVGGEPLEVEQGFYRVVVQTSPPKTFAEVEVPGEKEVQLEVN